MKMHLSLALFLIFWICWEPTAAKELRAKVVLRWANKSSSFGTLELKQNYPSKVVTIKGTLKGVTPQGQHGFHVHTSGNMGNACKDAQGHFNPENLLHGAPNDTERHVGDLGNVMADSMGNVVIDIQDSMIQLTGNHSVIGRALVIHEQRDDLGRGGNSESKKTGNAGKRIGCGLISDYQSSDASIAQFGIASFVAVLISVIIAEFFAV